jgi:hypothetical protein
MSGCPEERIGEWLLKSAVYRGASHYERDFPDDLPGDVSELSNEEIAVTLCLGQHPYNSTFIRAALVLFAPSLATAACLFRRRRFRTGRVLSAKPTSLLSGVARIASGCDGVNLSHEQSAADFIKRKAGRKTSGCFTTFYLSGNSRPNLIDGNTLNTSNL